MHASASRLVRFETYNTRWAHDRGMDDACWQDKLITWMQLDRLTALDEIETNTPADDPQALGIGVAVRGVDITRSI